MIRMQSHSLKHNCPCSRLIFAYEVGRVNQTYKYNSTRNSAASWCILYVVCLLESRVFLSWSNHDEIAFMRLNSLIVGMHPAWNQRTGNLVINSGAYSIRMASVVTTFQSCRGTQNGFVKPFLNDPSSFCVTHRKPKASQDMCGKHQDHDHLVFKLVAKKASNGRTLEGEASG